jgi:hypothetical protein
MTVAKVIDGSYHYVGGTSGCSRDSFESFTLEKGNYVVFIEMNWNTNDNVTINEFVFSAYGVGEAVLECVYTHYREKFLEVVF